MKASPAPGLGGNWPEGEATVRTAPRMERRHRSGTEINRAASALALLTLPLLRRRLLRRRPLLLQMLLLLKVRACAGAC